MTTVSGLVVAHNEEAQLAECLASLKFVDELVVVLDKCTDNSKKIAQKFKAKIIEGSWAIEGERRNIGLAACTKDWTLELDADERVTKDLANEILGVIKTSSFGYHKIPVDNYVGKRLVKHGWGGSFGKPKYAGLFKSNSKTWGNQRVHPSVKFTGNEGPELTHAIIHYVDRNLSDMVRRLDSYSTARAADLRASGKIGTFANNFRRLWSRFIRCYFFRKGYKEGGYGFLIALFAGLFPLLSYMKAKFEDD